MIVWPLGQFDQSLNSRWVIEFKLHRNLIALGPQHDRGAAIPVIDCVAVVTHIALKIPLILDEAVNIDEEGLLTHEFDELLHERPQSPLRHSWHQLVVQESPKHRDAQYSP